MRPDLEKTIPPLAYRWLTPLYDPLLRLLDEERFKRPLLEQAGPLDGLCVLDLGCGTGTLTLFVKALAPGAEVVGIDPDPDALARARRKADATGLPVTFCKGSATALPFPAGSFDRVVSSLVFHHLTSPRKRRAFAEIRRVLRAGGTLHVADWGEARRRRERVAFLAVQLFDGFVTTADNVAGRLVPLMREAGFGAAAETRRFDTMLGPLALYRADLPDAAPLP